MIRIMARSVPWPSLAVRPNREGLRLRWNAETEDGEVLSTATEYPLLDGAFALLARGADPEALVTMRHAGAAHDSFEPMPLRIPAAAGAKRAARRASAADLATQKASTRAAGRKETAHAASIGAEVRT